MCSAPAHPSRSLWDLLQFLDILHEVEDPKLVPAYQAKPCQSQIERDNNFHQTTSHSPLNVAQNVVHLIHIQSALLVNIQLYILHDLQGPHSRLATQPLGSHVQIYRVTLLQGQNFALLAKDSPLDHLQASQDVSGLKLFPLAYHEQKHTVFISLRLFKQNWSQL